MYEIIRVPDNAADLSEQMGTKFKFWYEHPVWGRTLFKEGRPGTGENWAEVLASRLAQTLGIPHARYEFAEYVERLGVVSPSLVPKDGRLIHGNEVLSSSAQPSDGISVYKQRSHTLLRVLGFLGASDAVHTPTGFHRTAGIQTALDVFVGYLLFDAWIANQDRHDENWALIRSDGLLSLASSYDHGSSMGRNETDEKRAILLSTPDKNQHISTYVQKARSAFYPQGAGVKTKAMLTLEVFGMAHRLVPAAAEAWQTRLKQCDQGVVEKLVYGLPAALVSPIAKEFTTQLLMLNRDRVLKVE